MRTTLCVTVVILLTTVAVSAQESVIRIRLFQRWRERIAGFLPCEASADALQDRRFLQELSRQYPDNLAVYTAMVFADKAFRHAEKERLHKAQTASTLGKIQLGILLLHEWLDTSYIPTGQAKELDRFKTLHQAETLLEAGYKARGDPFIGYLLAVAFSYDSSRETRFQDMRQQLLSALQHFVPATMVRQITEGKATERPEPLTVVRAVPPENRRQVRTILRTYREWLMFREWIGTIEPGKPRIRKQVAPTKEQEQLARYLEQVIARL